MGDELVIKQYNELLELAEKREERISSTNDITMNKKLFFLLRKAADALKSIEDQTANIEKMNQELEERKVRGIGLLGFVFVAAIVMAIVSFAFYYHIEHSDSIAERTIEYALANGSDAERKIAQENLDKYYSALESETASKPAKHLYFHAWYVSLMYKHVVDRHFMENYRAELYPIRSFIGSFKGWFVLTIVLSVLYTIWATIYNKVELAEYIPSQNKKIADATKDLQQYIKDNKGILQCVPKACHSSEWLYRVVTVYETGKADNMKEALNLADTGEYRDKMIDISQASCAALMQVLAQVDDIRGQLEDYLWY